MSTSRFAVVAAAAALLVGGCRGDGAATRDGTGAGGAALRSRALTDTLSLARPTGLVAARGTVVVMDGLSAEVVRVFDRAGALVAAAGREGPGPREFVGAVGLFPRPGRPGELWVHDMRLNRLSPVDLDTLLRAPGAAAAVGSPVSLSPGLLLESPRWLDDSTLVALNPMLEAGEGRFALFGADGVRRRTVGAPPPGEAGVAAFVRQQAYGGHMAVHPSRPLFVIGSRYAGRLEAFGPDGALRVRFQVPQAFEPDFRPAPDGLNMIRGGDFRFGYLDVAATGERVYALFSGRSTSEFGTRAEDAREVHVFGWDGRLRKVLRLDTAVDRLAVDEAAGALYATRSSPYPQVVTFPLDPAAL